MSEKLRLLLFRQLQGQAHDFIFSSSLQQMLAVARSQYRVARLTTNHQQSRYIVGQCHSIYIELFSDCGVIIT